ncbi:hypothetical protein PtB15_4B829 [Puccinia triticina]|nr:hypothetical protein PtB15_4B829 [Puccinia triticina]
MALSANRAGEQVKGGAGAKFHCNLALAITTTLLPSQPYSTSTQLVLFLLNYLPKKASNYQIKLDALAKTLILHALKEKWSMMLAALRDYDLSVQVAEAMAQVFQLAGPTSRQFAPALLP